MSRRALWLAVAAAGLVAGSAMSGSAAAGPSSQTSRVHDVTCHSGDIITGFHGNVTVPRGNYCELLQAIVEGNVYAYGAVQLGVDNSTVTGNIIVSGVSDNGWICGSRVGGSITVAKSASNPDTSTSPGMWDIGDPNPSYCGDTQFDPVPGNSIMGDLNLYKNSSGAALSNNDIEGDLHCSGNTPPPTGGNNPVDGVSGGQCAALAGGTDDDTLSPGDND